MLFLILKYYAAIAASWFAYSSEIEAAQSGVLHIALAFCDLLHARITCDADCYGQNDERGDFLICIYKEKTPPDVWKSTEKNHFHVG